MFYGSGGVIVVAVIAVGVMVLNVMVVVVVIEMATTPLHSYSLLAQPPTRPSFTLSQTPCLYDLPENGQKNDGNDAAGFVQIMLCDHPSVSPPPL